MVLNTFVQSKPPDTTLEYNYISQLTSPWPSMHIEVISDCQT